MNPITQTRNQNAMNERELRLGYTGTESSWHRQYKDSAWIFIGGLSYDLCEGDIICVFSQYGEIANINLVRDKQTGRPKGFAFVCYENQKSTVLATDNLNGIKVRGRVIRVDHVEKYRVPSEGVMRVGRQDADQEPTGKGEINSVTDFVLHHGCGPEAMKRIAELQKKAREGAPPTAPQQSGVSMKTFPSPPRRNNGQESFAEANGSHKRRKYHDMSPPRGLESPDRKKGQFGLSQTPPRHRKHSGAPRFSRGPLRRAPSKEDVSPPRYREAGVTPPRSQSIMRSPLVSRRRGPSEEVITSFRDPSVSPPRGSYRSQHPGEPRVSLQRHSDKRNFVLDNSPPAQHDRGSYRYQNRIRSPVSPRRPYISPPRRKNRGSDGSVSPPRNRTRQRDLSPDVSPPRRNKRF